MKNKTIYITVRVDLLVPDNYALSDNEIVDSFVAADVFLPHDSLLSLDNVSICGVNDML